MKSMLKKSANLFKALFWFIFTLIVNPLPQIYKKHSKKKVKLLLKK